MPIGATPVSVVNGALQHTGQQVRVFDINQTTGPGAAAAAAALVIYAPTVQLLLREIDPDFARYTAPLAIAVAPPSYPPWAFEYLWPASCLRLRQVRPPGSGTGSLTDPNDPQPIRANVAFDVISGVSTKVILSNQQNALAVYTSSTPSEAQWDSVFQDAVIRRLANPLSMALAGRPDFAKTILEQSAQMAQTAMAVDDSGFRRFG